VASKWICFSDDEMDLIDVWASLSDDKRLAEAIIRKVKKVRKRITVSSAKGKGRELQKWACRRIADLLEEDYDQQDDQSLIHSREMGQAGVDIVLRGLVQKWFPFSIECKSAESLNLKATVEQAKANTVKGTKWLIFHRRKSLAGTMVIMDAETFFDVVGTDVGMRRQMFPRPVYLECLASESEE